MKIRSEKGFTGVDISVSVIILFIFVTVIAILIYQVSSTSKEIKIKSDATYIAINEIEQVKNNGINAYLGINENSGPILDNIEVQEGFYETITVLDYKDVKLKEDQENGTNEAQNIQEDIVKKVTVKISYMFKGDEQSVELATILSKES